MYKIIKYDYLHFKFFIRKNLTMKKHLLFLPIYFLFFIPVAANVKTDPIIINSTVTNPSAIPRLSRNLLISIGTINDNTLSKVSGILGSTRTGIKTTVPIIAKPSLAETVQKSFESVLGKMGNLSTDPTIATYVLDLTITDCTLTENSSFFSQTMTAFLKMEVKITDPLAADKPHSFTIECLNSTKALDTTKYAQITLQDVIIDAIGEICKTINKF